MKTTKLQKMAVVVTVASLAWSASTALAQDSSAANPTPPIAVNTSVPQLAYGVPQILQLAQAKVGEATIIAYIKNSGNSYALNADQIIYLRQQGISDGIITTMLSQPRPGLAVATPTAPASPPMAATDYSGQGLTATPPPVAGVQTVPDSTYYSQPYYSQPYYYYPDYAWYPPVPFSFGWGGGYYGGGWRGGGYGGGGHGGGGYGGGGHGGGGHGGGHR
jgi:uncharacterized membrane protein YgcG